jgi:hypothetical protein
MFRRSVLIVLVAILLCAVSARAQEVTVEGAVVDASKSVLPGVNITATEVSSGRTYESVTNERGEYRLLGMLPGRYEIKAALSGFDTTVLSNLEFLVGQNANVPITMKVASIEEAITVTGASPLVDISSAQIAGNVNPRQMESIPLSGRNWLDLSGNVAGANVAGLNSFAFGKFQLNLDGQQITQDTSVTSFGQTGLSRDAIAEYQVATTPYDVSSGRSVGLQVDAVSKSGGNEFHGSTYAYIRSDSFNTADPYKAYTGSPGVVLPFKDQQIGATFGGPIVHDRTQFFMSYEHDHNPSSLVIHPTVYVGQQITAATQNDLYNMLARLDQQFSSRDHVVGRFNLSHQLTPSDGISSGLADPSRAAAHDVTSYAATLNFTHVAQGNTLHEARVGYYTFYWTYGPGVSPNSPNGYVSTPEYIFPALTIGLNWNYPEYWNQENIPVRYDMTSHRGSHEIKAGGEIEFGIDHGDWPYRSRGQMYFKSTPADFATRFPLDQDPSHWNFTGLDSTVIRFDQTYANSYKYHMHRAQYAAWLGDTWRPGAQLTLNLGLRYDLNWGQFAPPGVTETTLMVNNGLFSEDIGYKLLRDTNNVGVRGGAVWNVGGNNDFVVRAGGGVFYSGVGANPAIDEQLGVVVRTNSYQNDGQPGFIADPTRGITAAQVLAGTAPLTPQSIAVLDPNIQTPQSWQTSIGFQKQLGRVTGFEANLVYLRGTHEESVRDPNLFYDPVTGWPKDPTKFGRPLPQYGPIRLIGTNGRSRSLTLPMTFTRRYSKRFELTATYTYVFISENAGVGGSGYGNDQIDPFNINYNYGYSGAAKHSFRANGLWNLPWGVNFAGAFQYSSGTYSTYSSGLSPLGGYGNNRLTADLSFIPRNTFHNDPSNQLDLRVSKDFKIGDRVRVTGIAEAFNVYKATLNSYDLRQNSVTFGKISNITGIRTGQLAFRLSF